MRARAPQIVISDAPNYSVLSTTGEPQSPSNPSGSAGQRSPIASRFWIGFMAFAGCMITFVLRSNMSINILAMVRPTNGNSSVVTLPDYGPRYDWTPYQQSTVLGAFFYGTTLAGLPCGLLVDRYGCVRRFMLAACLLAAVLEFASPWVAASFGASFAVRLAMGATQGVLYPGMHKLFTRWAPPDELGKFTSTMMGGNVGTICSWAISGVLIERCGWQWSFYGAGALTVAFCAGWWWCVFDSPAEHPRCGREEREYIERSLADLNEKPSWTPLRQVLTSVPTLALIVLQYGNLWGFLFLVTGAPRFMNEVLGFSLAQAGLLASLPYICRWLGGIVFALLADWMRRRRAIGLMNLRRLFCVFSHILPGLLLAAMPFAGANPYVAVALMTASFGLNGAVTQTAFANIHDLTPNYAASVLSISNFFGGTSGFVTPLVVTYFTKDNNTFEGWQSVFLLGAAIYIVPALVFMWLGSASVQPYNGYARAAVVTDATKCSEVAGTKAQELLVIRSAQGARRDDDDDDGGGDSHRPILRDVVV